MCGRVRKQITSRTDDKRDAHHEIARERKAEEKIRPERTNDDRDGLRKATQDIPGVFDRHRYEHPSERVACDDTPREAVEAV